MSGCGLERQMTAARASRASTSGRRAVTLNDLERRPPDFRLMTRAS